MVAVEAAEVANGKEENKTGQGHEGGTESCRPTGSSPDRLCVNASLLNP